MSVKIDQSFVVAFRAGGFGMAIDDDENAAYSGAKPYAEIRTHQNEVQGADLAHTDDTTGVFQVILRYDEGSGAFDAKAKADDILDAFPIGLKLAHDGVTSKITGKHRQRAVPEDGVFKIVLRFSYRAFLAR